MFKRIVKRLKERHSLLDIRQRRKTVLTEDNVTTILAYFEAYPTSSLTDAEENLGFSYSSIQKALKSNGYKAYKVMPVQALRQGDYDRRREFCQVMLLRQQEDSSFINRIIFTDESSFSTAGRHNRRNTHVWAQTNPHIVAPRENQGHQTVNVWCGIYRTKILGPVFIEGRLNGAGYLELLQRQIGDMVSQLNEANLIWQQDGAPVHNIAAVREFLNDNYGTWIGRGGTISWPARSPDLNPLDFFLWGHLKQVIYEMGGNSLEELKNKIRTEVENLNSNPALITSVQTNFARRLAVCIANNGGHFEQLL